MTQPIYLRRGTAAAWTTANPVLSAGEPGFETDTLKFKLGDGVTAWVSLAYQGVDAALTKAGVIATGLAATDIGGAAVDAAGLALAGLVPTGDTSGVGDYNRVQAALTAVAATGRQSRVRLSAGANGSSYVVNQTLCIHSNTFLDVDPGVTLGLAGTTQAPILANYASGVCGGPSFTAINVAVTSGSTSIVASGGSILASRFNSFTGSTPVVIHDHLGGTFATTGTYVDSTHITLAAAPTLTVPAAYIEVGPRDHDIRIEGLNIVRGSSDIGVESWMRIAVPIVRCDRLTMRNLTGQSSSGFTMFMVGDVTAVKVDKVDFPGAGVFRDGIDINGPAYDIEISNVTGTTGDDGIPILPTMGAPDALCWGPVSKVRYKNINIASATGTATIWCADASGYGSNPASPASFPWVDDVVWENVIQPLAGVAALDLLNGSTTYPMRIGKLSIRNIYGPIAIAPNGEIGTIDRLVINDWTVPPNLGVNIPALAVKGGVVVDKLIVRNASGSTTNNGNRLVAVDTSSTVNYLDIDDVVYSGTGTGCELVGVVSATATIGTLKESKVVLNAAGIGILLNSGFGGTVGKVFLTDCDMSGYVFAILSQNCEVYYSNIRGPANTGGIGAVAGGLTIRGAGYNGPSNNGTATSHSQSLDWPCDVSSFAKANGDRAYNTNAALACGVGPVVCNGTNWKNIYTGAVY